MEVHRVLGDISVAKGQNREALEHYFNALVSDPYCLEAIAKIKALHDVVQMDMDMDFYPVIGIKQYCQQHQQGASLTRVMLGDSSYGELVELNNVHALGQSSVLFSDEQYYLVNDDELADVQRSDIVSTTLARNILGFVASDEEKKPHRVLAVFPREVRAIPRCIILNNRASDNYFHWLIETLPNWMLIESCREYDDYPVLVHGHMPSQHYEALRHLVGEKRTITLAESNKTYQIDQAIIPLPLSHILFDPLPGVIPQEHDVRYHPAAIAYLQTRLGCAHTEEMSLGRKIYLSRKSSRLGKRKMRNQDEVEALFVHHGFELIDTAELSFDEQVALFASCRIVAGPSGASFANLVFCHPDCQVILFAQKENNLGIYYRHLAKVCGLDKMQEVQYSVPIKMKDQSWFHDDYELPLDDIRTMMS